MTSARAGTPKKQDPYLVHLERGCHEVIDDLHIHEIQKKFLRERWLKELIRFERKSVYNQKRHYTLRLVTIVGGVVVPSLVSLDVRKSGVAETIAWTTFAVSLVVAIAAALESFFGYGDRWRTFRRTAEALKAHGWQFFQLAGRYSGSPDHSAAFSRFATQVEMLLERDMEAFVTHSGRHQPSPDLRPEEIAIVPPAVTTAPAPS